MKLPWSRKPLDLVQSQLAEFEERKIEQVEDPFFDSMIDYMNDQITASGGWCAPSDTIYNLPDMQVRRGGIKVPLRDKITMTTLRM